MLVIRTAMNNISLNNMMKSFVRRKITTVAQKMMIHPSHAPPPLYALCSLYSGERWREPVAPQQPPAPPVYHQPRMGLISRTYRDRLPQEGRRSDPIPQRPETTLAFLPE